MEDNSLIIQVGARHGVPLPGFFHSFYSAVGRRILSIFTHAAGAVRLTCHPGGFIGLWRSLVGKKRFPVQYLTDAGETLQDFVARGDER